MNRNITIFLLAITVAALTSCQTADSNAGTTTSRWYHPADWHWPGRAHHYDTIDAVDTIDAADTMDAMDTMDAVDVW